MILLELTEKETDILSLALIKEGYILRDKNEENPGKAEIEKNLTLLNTLWAKLDTAKSVQSDVLIKWKDLHDIIDNAKGEYQKLPKNLRVSNKAVYESDYAKISLANSLIMWLNKNGLLKRLPRFDFTDILKQYGV